QVLQLGVAVLSHIPTPEDGFALFRKPQHLDSWMHIIATRILRSLYRDYGAFLGRHRNPSEMERITHKICLNTARPISDSITDPEEWLAQFEGPNLLWESLGILFNFWDLPADPANPESSTPQVRALAGLYSPLAHECLIRCLNLSEEFSQGTVLLLYLHYRRTNLEYLVSGEASRQVWRSHAATVSAVTFFGIHAEKEDPLRRPSLASEAKRRVLAAIIDVDKELAAFTGRLPLLAQRYTTSPMPLDLKDEYLFMDQETLASRAADTPDEHGWNKDGDIHSGTYSRASMISARFREQVIEIALGPVSTSTVAEILKLKSLHAEMMAGLPKRFHYTAGDILDLSLKPIDIHFRSNVKMYSLQTEFYLDRLLIRNGKTDDGNLLATSCELLSVINSIWTNRERFESSKENIGWMSITYGGPSAGILCKELLRPTFFSTHRRLPVITRSSIIQQLLVFVTCLDWVCSWGSNREISHGCKSVIQRVLDHVLNTTTTSEMTDTTGWDLPAPLDFNFDILDTFDYMWPD
ncbi:hypothetical protein GQ53DRAFT_617320, partial [Thozetella sp. PMI_491]